MSKIVIRGQFPIRPGKTEQGKAAAMALRERVLREDPGVVLYEFFIDDEKKEMAITEAYADESSLIQHIEASDFAPLFETLDFAAGKLQIHGEPSTQLRARLASIVGPFELFRPL